MALSCRDLTLLCFSHFCHESFWTCFSTRQTIKRRHVSFAMKACAENQTAHPTARKDQGRVLWCLKSDPQGHPDPDGFHLAIVCRVVEKCLAFYDSADLGLFWDFGSLYQNPRKGIQNELFVQGLKASNIWYASTESNVWTAPQFNGPPRLVSRFPRSRSKLFAFSRLVWPGPRHVRICCATRMI